MNQTIAVLYHNTKITMMYHHRDSIRPKDNITMLPLSRFYPFLDYGLVVIGWTSLEI
jgi:hypothetical protein